ncbi:hypothetical protein K439DRAFT_1623448 [Ramaria rubella]|nr:hypothetical protein K439DRAFT_1623448 [Ramaria rubella]
MFAWLLRCISTLSMAKCTPQLLNTKQLAQLSVHKCTTAFVNVCDDLETKIGHLSCHLDFLMTELDLWCEKFMFIMFKHYAEKLSDEAAKLRVKINKGRKEKLRETEGTHCIVIIELEEMCQNIIKMEEKCSAIVAEVEVQTKRTLQSMMISKSDLENMHDEELKAPISPHCCLAA